MTVARQARRASESSLLQEISIHAWLGRVIILTALRLAGKNYYCRQHHIGHLTRSQQTYVSLEDMKRYCRLQSTDSRPARHADRVCERRLPRPVACRIRGRERPGAVPGQVAAGAPGGWGGGAGGGGGERRQGALRTPSRAPAAARARRRLLNHP